MPNKLLLGAITLLTFLPLIHLIGLVAAPPPSQAQNATLQLQCLYSNYPVTTDERITIIGNLSPARSGTITLYWSINNSGFIYRWNGTTTNGIISRTFGFCCPGVWGFRLVWEGDDEYNGATSNQIFITVISPVASDDWAKFRHDIANTGHSPSSAQITNQTNWVYTSPGAIRASPAIANGVVYVGSFGGSVYAVNATTGALLWSYLTGGHIWSSPAVSNGIVYVGANDNYLYALNAATGEKLWAFDTGGAVFSSPAIYEGTVYIGSIDNRVYALNAATGTQFWNYTTGGQVRASPAIAEGVLYIASEDGYIYALNAFTGANLWVSPTYPGDSYTCSSPAVSGGIVYVGAWDGKLYAFNASTGERLWYHTTGGIIESSPAVANGMVFVGSDDGSLLAVDAVTGRMIWFVSVGSQVYSSPAVAGGIVYFGTWGGDVYALNATTGATKWTYRTGNGVFSSPAIANGMMCIGSYDSKLYAFGTYTESYPPPYEEREDEWVPATESAVQAAAVAGVATAVVSLAPAAFTNPIGGIWDRILERIKDLIPTNLKKWLEYFLLSKRKMRLQAKIGSKFMPTPSEVLAYIVSIVMLAITFAYAKASSVEELASILPIYFATGIIVGLVKRYFTIAFLRSRGVWTEHKVWLFGLALLVFTTIAFRMPFATPTRNVNYSEKYTGRLKATVAISWVLIGLAFAGLFALLMPFGFVQLGSAGLAMCVIGALFDTFPIPPLVGKSLFDHNKILWAMLFALTVAIYIAWLMLM
uniref:Pyrrolo-quinoline quinone repeat domain-containing protein n=1 Tax=Candidatus Methanomethylicus mesodigestus TaxID=1867258 RepID=A0A7C3FBI8_9CREN